MAAVRDLALVLAAVAATLTLAACGGGEESGGGPAGAGATTATDGEGDAAAGGGAAGAEDVGDEDRIEAAIAAVLTSVRAKEVCDEAVTPAFLERAYGDRAGCAALIAGAGAQARAAEISRLEIDGGVATAVVRPDGGIYDGEQLDATLVREGGAWRLDRLDADIPVGP